MYPTTYQYFNVYSEYSESGSYRNYSGMLTIGYICDSVEVLVDRKIVSLIDCLTSIGGLFSVLMMAAKISQILYNK